GKCHRLSHHRLTGPCVCFVTIGQCHRCRRALRCKELRLASFPLGEIPERRYRVLALLPTVVLPVFSQLDIGHLVGVDQEAMTEHLRLAAGNLQFTERSMRGADAELIVHTPWLRKTGVLRMIKDGHMRHVVPSLYRHSDVEPHGPLPLGLLITLA